MSLNPAGYRMSFMGRVAGPKPALVPYLLVCQANAPVLGPSTYAGRPIPLFPPHS